jgi:hypothetical protein
MEMVAHPGIAANFDAEEPCQFAQAIKNPVFAVALVLPGVGVDATEEGPPGAAGHAVINADLVVNDDLAPGRKWASMRLLKQRRASTAKFGCLKASESP